MSAEPAPAIAELRDRLIHEVERVLSAAEAVDPAQRSWTPSANGANSLLVLAAHTVGAAERHVVRSIGGGEVSGTREQEFAANTDLPTIRARWEKVRRRVVAAFAGLPVARLDEELTEASRSRTIHGLLVHAVTHAAEHAGQAELTRDLLKEQAAR